ncbi:hypothetical protein ALT_7038 [Aspergillus lentulus]|uniref:DUF1308 domain-containing protein n=1 Tax=Aspergillus lentulus TaxID=293939 RepID=A0AAN6BRV6_ASPLE|nr:hypothetical protein CNMCM6069_006391 [Aspergillus lentulus]KAF4166076.1 hypothetical protein CNMCM6936_007056 [Aspergillus lentulus]KAF4177982.1 hypothetical protein CNMCM8060_004852 [Aspergillus lentulus]KAF4188325.1 hypothetical protein CNMCM7927_001998 [Aspergillus lentulus]KAF4196735.1 hypothetical protein CNMCM8694_004457 [Aspergillus lentulus]
MHNNDPGSRTFDNPRVAVKDDFRDKSDPENSRALATSLVNKCRRLLGEIDTLQSMLIRNLRNPQLVEVRSLRSNVLSELRMLEKLSKKVHAVSAKADAETRSHDDQAELRLLHALRSSNLPFYEAVWNVAKNTCTGLVAFGKRFYWDAGAQHGGKGPEESQAKKASQDKRKSVFVDIVADDGEEWVKVSTISETRLLFEMAKKGWEAESEDGGDGEPRTVLRNYDNDDFDSDEDDDDEVELIKLACGMRKAANATRIRYKHPRLRFVIPKIEEGKGPEIDDLLKEIRSYGITVNCGGEVARARTEDAEGPEHDAVEEGELSQLLPSPFKRFTSTLNVDCTLLLAMVSDLSHYKTVTLSPSHHKAIFKQVEVEKQRPLLPTELWPATTAHDLVCTEEAARRMREIVDTIGTEAERRRAQLLMGDAPFNDCDTTSLLERFQELSDYEVPSGWEIPIRTVNAKSAIEAARDQGILPPVSRKVAKILSDINYSVFMYGWSTGVTTISSNRTVVKQIETTIEEHRNGDEGLEGPPVWVCDTARSLAGKDKDRKM